MNYDFIKQLYEEPKDQIHVAGLWNILNFINKNYVLKTIYNQYVNMAKQVLIEENRKLTAENEILKAENTMLKLTLDNLNKPPQTGYK